MLRSQSQPILVILVVLASISVAHGFDEPGQASSAVAPGEPERGDQNNADDIAMADRANGAQWFAKNGDPKDAEGLPLQFGAARKRTREDRDDAAAEFVKVADKSAPHRGSEAKERERKDEQKKQAEELADIQKSKAAIEMTNQDFEQQQWMRDRNTHLVIFCLLEVGCILYFLFRRKATSAACPTVRVQGPYPAWMRDDVANALSGNDDNPKGDALSQPVKEEQGAHPIQSPRWKGGRNCLSTGWKLLISVAGLAIIIVWVLKTFVLEPHGALERRIPPRPAEIRGDDRHK